MATVIADVLIIIILSLPELLPSVVTLSIEKPLRHFMKCLGKLKYSSACLQEQIDKIDYFEQGIPIESYTNSPKVYLLLNY